MNTIQEIEWDRFKISTGSRTENGDPIIVCGGPNPNVFEKVRLFVPPDGLVRVEPFSAASVAC